MISLQESPALRSLFANGPMPNRVWTRGCGLTATVAGVLLGFGVLWRIKFQWARLKDLE